MKKSNSVWNDLLKPVVVLTVICIVVSAALAAANGITAPIIAKNAALAADASRIELLPEATDGFDQVEISMEGITEMHKAKNGVGYVISCQANGYGGPIKLMVAYDNDGAIVSVKILELSETPGVGDRVKTMPSFLEQFVGINGELKKGDNVDTISGATISSSAVIEALNTAYKAFNEKAKGIVVEELSFEDEVAQYFGNMTAMDVTHEDVLEAYTSDKGTVLVTEGDGNGIIGEAHPSGLALKAYVSFDENGVITGVMFDSEASETKGLGTKVSDEEYINKFVGQKDGEAADVLAGVTYSSKGAKEAVNKAAAAFAAING